MPDPPALADLGLVDVDARGGEVLAELAVADRPAELVGPGVEVLAREGVDRLVDAAVVLGVGDLVALEPEPARPATGPSTGRLSMDGAADRRPSPGLAGVPTLTERHAWQATGADPAARGRRQSWTALAIVTHA